MTIKTGLGKFDSLLKGGIPNKSSVMLLGPPKAGKTLFGLHFLLEGLKSNESGVYIVTNNFPEDIVKKMEGIVSIDKILENGLLRFVDCYSVHAGIHKDNTAFIIRVGGPTALTEIGIAFSEVMKKIPEKNNIRVVFDSVSTLLLYNNPRTIEIFVQQINGKMKAGGASSMFIVEEGMHDEKDVTALNSILDSLIHMKKRGSGWTIETDGLGLEKNINYSIKDNKIIIG
ncbi:MAG: hypothetical protein HYT71_03820 [Candidatus Aenigmarchaeota archaeon]|nr:hypothetical protein [Candidatus Aenigmarchaeota archaeon]